MEMTFRDRTEAGKMLAQRLTDYANDPAVIVLALPRGGVPVAREVSRALKAPLDLYGIRKLSVPGISELAMGAIACDGAQLLDDDAIERMGISQDDINHAIRVEKKELERRDRIYRGNRPFPSLAGRTVILVDDGAATGSTMLCAVRGVRQSHPKKVVVALPVAPGDTIQRLRLEADDVVVLSTPRYFFAVGQWYSDFTQVPDADVVLADD